MIVGVVKHLHIGTFDMLSFFVEIFDGDAASILTYAFRIERCHDNILLINIVLLFSDRYFVTDFNVIVFSYSQQNVY